MAAGGLNTACRQRTGPQPDNQPASGTTDDTVAFQQIHASERVARASRRLAQVPCKPEARQRGAGGRAQRHPRTAVPQLRSTPEGLQSSFKSNR